MKFNKKTKKELLHIEECLTNVYRFLHKENITINNNGEPIDKNIGSELCYLKHAIDDINYLMRYEKC